MSRLLVRVLRVLPVLGLVLTIVGIGLLGPLPDGWWDPKGFVVNLASGVTAACFGVPLAFFVLQRLLVERERSSRRLELVRRAARTARELHAGLPLLCQPWAREGVALREDMEVATEVSDDMGRALDPWWPDDGDDLLRAARRSLATLPGHRLMAPVRPRPSESETADQVQMRIRYVGDVLNPSLIDEDLPPFSAGGLRVLRDFADWVQGAEVETCLESFRIVGELRGTAPPDLDVRPGDDEDERRRAREAEHEFLATFRSHLRTVARTLQRVDRALTALEEIERHADLVAGITDGRVQVIRADGS